MTVADDLLKNDGQKFLEMMESLADKRIQREREAAEGLLDDEDEDDEEDEEEEDEYDDDEDEEDEDEEGDDEEEHEEVMTEEQRMEEGRRMFQIFAARMLEQRVLTAYREKVGTMDRLFHYIPAPADTVPNCAMCIAGRPRAPDAASARTRG